MATLLEKTLHMRENEKFELDSDGLTTRVKVTAKVTESALPNGAATEAKQDSQITLATSLNTKVDASNTLLTAIGNVVSKEAKQDTQITAANLTNTKLDEVKANQVTLLGAVAKETKQDTQITAANLTNTKLDEIKLKQDAQTTLQTSIANTSNTTATNTADIKTKLDTLNAKDFATSAKQDAQSTLLTTANTLTTSTNTKLDTLNAKDFATSAKQDSIITILNNLSRRAGAVNSSTLRVAAINLDQNGSPYVYNFGGPSNSQPVMIVGRDGLYGVAVDSVGRMSVNANVTFPEAIYDSVLLSNAGSTAMNVNGATTPVLFSYQPTGAVRYIESMSFGFSDDAAINTVGFGGLAALTNGLLITIRSKGVVYTITTIKTNSQLFNFFCDQKYSQTIAGLLGAVTILINGSTKFQQRMVLDPAFSDYIRVSVRDNLTGLTDLIMSVKTWNVNS